MSVAPPPATYTATNDLNIIKNIFVPQYQFINGYFRASVNTQLPGNVTVGTSNTNFSMTLNGNSVMTLSDVQLWSQWDAVCNVNMCNNSIVNTGKVLFGNAPSTYTINAPLGTLNVSQYFLTGTALTLSGGLPAWASYPASANVLMQGVSLSGAGLISLSAGGTITNAGSNVITFSNPAFGETMRIDQSGHVSVGTTTPTTYAMDVSGGAVISAPFVVCVNDLHTDSNAFLINTIPNASTNVDIQIGSVGPNTNLFLCTNSQQQVEITNAGKFTVLQSGISTSLAAVQSVISGVGLYNGNITSQLNISVTANTTLTLIAGNQSTTYLLTNTAGFNGITLPGSTVPAGTYWTIKNASTSPLANAVTITNGSIVNIASPTSLVLGANALTTIVYSGTSSNYYAL